MYDLYNKNIFTDLTSSMPLSNVFWSHWPVDYSLCMTSTMKNQRSRRSPNFDLL